MSLEKRVYPNPRIVCLGTCLFFGHLHGGLLERGLIKERLEKFFLVIGEVPVEIFVVINYFFDASLTSNRMFFC